MDLLQGYGSDDSSSSVESGPSSTALKSPSTTTTRTAANTIATTSNAQITGYENAKLPRTSVSTSTSTSTSTPGRKSITNKKKGRRILKLNSVLPPDILERLTRSTVQSGGGSGTYDNDSTDDDDDDDDNDDDNVTKKQKSPTKNKIKKTFGKSQNNIGLGGASGATGSGDLGLDSLLSDLQSFIPTEGNKKKKIISKMKNTGNNKNNNKNNDSGDKKGNDSGKMGFAFMNVSKTVIQRKKHDPKNVVDIHATSKPTTVEDASSEDDSDDDDDNVDSNDAIPMFSSAQHVNVNENSKQKSIQSESTSSLSRRNNSVGAIKRPRRVVTAAPTVPSSFQSVKLPIQNRNMGMDMDMNSDFPSSSTNNLQHQQQYQQQTINDTNNDPSMRQTSKMSKRELEKALRTGNFDAIDSSNITQNIDTSNYMTPNEDDLLATASTSNPAASQYNTAKLQMYAPSEGTSVAMSEVTAQQRGKHQIHSLVANARKLEADRARLSAMGLGGRKSTRADAKRKYGW